MAYLYLTGNRLSGGSLEDPEHTSVTQPTTWHSETLKLEQPPLPTEKTSN